jgi:hypothetical protein
MWSMPSIIESTDLVGIGPRVFAAHVAARFDLSIFDLPMPISVM